MYRAAVNRTEHSPQGVVNIARLQNRRHALRIGHRGEVTIVGRSDLTAARCVRTIVANRLVADHRIVCSEGLIGLEALTAGREAIAIESRIIGRAHAHAMTCKLALVAIDENHAFSQWITTKLAAIARCKRFYFRQELGVDEIRGGTQPLAIGAKCRMHIQAVTPACARFVFCLHRRIAIGHKHHAIEVAADERFERDPQLRKFVR